MTKTSKARPRYEEDLARRPMRAKRQHRTEQAQDDLSAPCDGCWQGTRRRRTQPRRQHRGSGRRRRQLQLQGGLLFADLVQEGGDLARSEVGLPSDRWRDGEGSLSLLAGRNGRKKKRVRWGEGLRWEEGERDAGFSLRSIVRWEPAYVVKVVDESRGKGGRSRRGTERVEVRMEVRTPQQAEEAAAESSAALAEAASESDSGDEYDVLVDFSGNEADGWVPVMVAEEDEGEDWMSLTGSWVLMRGRGEAKKNAD
ncbi:uncharacterized protein THITE_2085908 [Thermothielavioides terrestris NRRL 8126]|uniref:Uncharacterized protein n=1 Tax=Thermothielavioides terrestris (strain ATCC 38088 / NRRL 8126) TaxID=578455 RepID=G2QT83_THETT|nr:uncharacterized protein THITE_2085908 [Thermothielavioides terrestris NRRL 8126]AEO64409.1 hypothetical protein THITE_2085908 [Thermothielavioides terrestris NRRL 8126]